MNLRTRIPAEIFHPGEFLKEELAERKVTQKDAAEALGISPQFLGDVLAGKRGVSAALAVRLGKYLGTTALFWMRLQDQWDMAAEL